MPTVPIIPVHEREHIHRVRQRLSSQPNTVRDRWGQAVELLQEAFIHEAFREFNDLSRVRSLRPELRADIQLQAVRCIDDAPVERVKKELAHIEPYDAYQALILDYRRGWLLRRQVEDVQKSLRYFEQAADSAGRLNTSVWKVAALLQKGACLVAVDKYEEALEVFGKVFNLSRRNGHIEFIPKALLHKGYVKVRMGEVKEGERDIQKAFELACRNELVDEQALALYRLAQVYHYDLEFYGLALEYYEQAREIFSRIPVCPSIYNSLQEDVDACGRDLANLDIAKILGPVSIDKLRQDYLTSLVNSFVGIPSIKNRSELAERVGLTRQTIHRTISTA